MLQKLILKQTGDTIIEALIALSILTFVLIGAYLTATKSYQNIRDAQEHSQALTIAQTQVEDLRSYGDNFGTPDNCFGPNLALETTACDVPSNSTDTVYTSGNLPAGTPYYYLINISKTSSFPVTVDGNSLNLNLNTYDVNVSWQALGGGQDDVTLYYRVDNS